MSKTVSNFPRYILTVACCVAITALGIVYLANSAPVVTTIGENISTNDLDVNGTTTISGNLNAKTGRSASVIVAASDSPDQIKAQADYVCDGIDDDVEIQEAINSGVKDIYLAEGTFNVTGFTVSDNDDLYFHGSGPATVIKLETDSPLETSNVVTFDNCDNVMVSDLVIDGNRENHALSTNEDKQNCLRFIGCDGADIHSVTTKNHWMSGIKIGSFSGSDACTNVKIYGNTVDHVYDQGISIWKSEYVTVSGNIVNDSGWAGISLTDADNGTIDNNLVSNCVYQVNGPAGEGSGIASEGATNFTISNNVVWGNNATGILISHWWEDWSKSRAGTVANNIVFGTLNGGSGIEVHDADGVIFSGNSISDNGVGFVFSASSSNCQVVGGTIKNNVNGIIIYGNNISVENNVFDGHSHESLWVGYEVSPKNITIINNQFVNGGGTYPLIAFSGVVDSVISDNTLISSPGRGISCDLYESTPCSNITISNNNISGSAADAIQVKQVHHVTIKGNNLQNNYRAMILEEGSYLTIVNNNLGFNELGLDLRSLQYSTISGNKVYNSNEQGIALKDFSIYNIISENVLFDDQGTPTQNRGFEELDSSDYNKIYSNIAFGNTDGQITPKGSHTVCKFNVGYNSEGSGSSVGTDSQQTIAHGLSFTPTPEQIVLTAGSSTAQPFLSADPDSTNIYVTAGSGQTWYWTVVSE